MNRSLPAVLRPLLPPRLLAALYLPAALFMLLVCQPCACLAEETSSKNAAPFEAGRATWRAEAASGDKVELKTDGGSLLIRYTVDVRDQYQMGNWTYNQKTFRLLLAEPVALPADTQRVVFEALGHEYKTWSTRDEVFQLWPLVRDAKGEIHAYIPTKYPHLYNGKTTWAGWMTLPFYCGEAGAATQDIYTSEGGDRNAWPDAPLTFLGFQAVVRKAKIGEKSGSAAIGGVHFQGLEPPLENPYFYADSLAKESGAYRFASSVATGYQQLPAREDAREVRLDMASAESRRQKLEVALPAGNGHFWIDYQLTAANGSLAGSGAQRYQVTAAPTACTAAALPAAQVPVIGFLRINPERNGDGVYDTGAEPVITARLFGKGQPALVLKWELLPCLYNTVIGSGEERAEFPADSATAYRDLSVRPALQAGRDAYRLRLTVCAPSGETLEKRIFTFGRRTDLSKPLAGREGYTPLREDVKKTSYNRATYQTISTDLPKSEDDALARFRRVLEEAGNMTRNWTYMLDIAALEPLPGVYDFTLIDRVLDCAAERGIFLTLRIGHIESEHPYRWLRYSRQHSFDGLEIDEHFYGGYTLADQEYLDVWHRTIRALHERYRAHRAFQGYYLLQPAGEFTIEDKPWEGIIAGYEKPMEEALRAYLRELCGPDIAALNRRWGTHYRDWAEVLPPRPDFSKRATPDLRMSWVDFSGFKFRLDDFGWYPQAAQKIRAYDKERVLILYGGPGALYRKDALQLATQADYFHNGGNHYPEHEGEYVAAWQKNRVGWISEPHHPQRWAAYGDPAQMGWVLDWTTYMMIAQAGGGGANLHLYYDPRQPNLPAHYGTSFAYDRYRRYQPILDELLLATPVSSAPEVGTVQDRLTLACKHRTVFASRMDDLKRCFELLKNEAIPFLRLDQAEPAARKGVKLIVPNFLDEVMSEENIVMLDKMVREDGCKLMLTAITGKYCPERGEQPWQLLTQLGIAAPTGEYVTTDAGIHANVVAENPLFNKGTTVPFYTLAQFQSDLQSAEIKKDFWRFPYRWIPQTDYFGYFRDNTTPLGEGTEVWASFASGAPALTKHKVGKGEVVVFWGVPDYRPEKLGGMMTRAADWAGVVRPAHGNPLPLLNELYAKSEGRYYAIVYNEKPGSYQERIPHIPAGRWFVSELVGDRKFGIYAGEALKSAGIKLDYLPGASPLQILRFERPDKMNNADWVKRYPDYAPPAAPAR